MEKTVNEATCRISDPSNKSIESIDLTHEVSLSDPSYGRIAGHLPDSIDTLCHKNSIGT
jgi:hypothetical protein